jgi:hypothetical protein
MGVDVDVPRQMGEPHFFAEIDQIEAPGPMRRHGR